MYAQLSEKKFEDHFCKKLKGFVKRDNSHTSTPLHIDFQLLEQFLQQTQEEEFNSLLQTYSNWKDIFLKTLKEELKTKHLVEILQQGITIQARYQFKFIFTQNTTSLNTSQQELVKANIFSYIRQYKFDESSQKSIDIVLFLNGFPITTIELKYKQKNQNVYSAVEQYLKRDLEQEIFKLPFLHIASDNDEVQIATQFKQKTSKDFRPFNVDIQNPTSKNDPYKISYIYKEILTKNSILHLLRNFIFVDLDKNLIFPRYHQLRCVNSIVQDISKTTLKKKSIGLKFLIEHSMGSGKSKTILWCAEQLKNLHTNNIKVFDSVFIVTDRVDLHTQISQDFKALPSNTDTITYVKNSKELHEAILRKDKVIIVILHNFTYLKKKDLDSIKKYKICFLIDETHRSQDGKLHSSMTDFFEKFTNEESELVYPNSAFIGFTATPTDKTLEKFGIKQQDNSFRAYDTYSMDQAIKEGYILDVTQHIIPFKTLYKLRKTTQNPLLEKEFNALQLYKATKQKAYENINIIKSKVKIILDFFKDKIEYEIHSKAKSMIVTSSRKSAIAYKHILDEEIKKLNLPYKSLVAFSGTQSCKELNLIDQTESTMNENFKGNISEKFKENEFKFLIVADKYQTGFDEPYLFAMFLDKPLKGINAVQTLGRLNRVTAYKKPPITIDFSNSYDEIKSAFRKFLKPQKGTLITDFTEFVALYQAIILRNIIIQEHLEIFKELLQVNKNVFQPKFEILLNKIKDNFNKVDIVTQKQFRKDLNKFSTSFNYINTITIIEDINIELLGLISKQVYLALAEVSNSKQELQEALELIEIESHKILPIKKVDSTQEERKGFSKLGQEREIMTLSINDIIELLDESYEILTLSGSSKEIFENYLKSILNDSILKKRIKSTPESEKNQTKKTIQKELEKRFHEHLFKSTIGLEILEKYRESNLLEDLNEYIYSKLQD